MRPLSRPSYTSCCRAPESRTPPAKSSIDYDQLSGCHGPICAYVHRSGRPRATNAYTSPGTLSCRPHNRTTMHTSDLAGNNRSNCICTYSILANPNPFSIVSNQVLNAYYFNRISAYQWERYTVTRDAHIGILKHADK